MHRQYARAAFSRSVSNDAMRRDKIESLCKYVHTFFTQCSRFSDALASLRSRSKGKKRGTETTGGRRYGRNEVK